MEKQIYVTKEDLDEFKEKLDEFMRQIQGLKSTIEILQDKEAMEEIRESENNRKEGKYLKKIDI